MNANNNEVLQIQNSVPPEANFIESAASFMPDVKPVSACVRLLLKIELNS